MGRVVIRTKKKCHGTMLSVYLEFCPPFTDNSGKQVRYEFLDLEKYTTPANEAQQKFNATIDDIADAIRCERYISLVHKDYEFISKRRINEDFLEYFHRNIIYRGIKFKVSLKYLHRFCKGKCSFKDVTVSFCERFKGFLSNTKGLHRRAKLSQNTASAYFNAFMSIVNLAHQDGIIKTDINQDISHTLETRHRKRVSRREGDSPTGTSGVYGISRYPTSVPTIYLHRTAPKRYTCTRLEECTHQFKEKVVP